MRKICFLIVVMMTVACGSGEETAVSTPLPLTNTPTKTPEPTATPSPEPTETPLPESTETAVSEIPIAFDDPYIDQLGQYTIATLAGYQTEADRDMTVEFSSTQEDGTGEFHYWTAGGMIAATPDELWEIIQRAIDGEEFGDEIEVFGPGLRGPIQLAGASGISIKTQYEEDDVLLFSETAVVTTDTQWFLLNSTMESTRWAEEAAILHEALLASVVFLLPPEEGTLILGELVTTAPGGHTVATLPGYEVEQRDGQVEFSPANRDDETSFRYTLVGGVTTALPEQQRTEMESFIQGESPLPDGEVIEQEPVEMFGLSGVTAIIRTDVGQYEFTGRFILLMNEEQYFIFYGGIESSRWQDEGEVIYEALLPTINLFAPRATSEMDYILGDMIISQLGGYKIPSLLNYDVTQDNDGFTEVSPSNKDDNTSFRYVVWGGLIETLPDEQKTIIEDVISGDGIWLSYNMSEREDIQFGEFSGITAVIDISERGNPFRGRIIVLTNDEQWFVLSGGIDTSLWDIEGEMIFNQLIEQLELFPPLLSGAGLQPFVLDNLTSQHWEFGYTL